MTYQIILERNGKLGWDVKTFDNEVHLYKYSKWKYVLERIRKSGFNKIHD